MQQFTAVLMPPITEPVEDQDVTFSLLKGNDLAPLAEKIRTKRKADASANGKAHKLNDVQMFRVHQEIDDSDVSIPEIGRWINIPEGATESVKLSLKKSGYDDAQQQLILDALDPVALTRMANLVTRFGRLPKKRTSGDAVDRPLTDTGNPTSSTGDSLPGSSADGSTATPENSPSTNSGINTAA